ncbi:unnamed protein product [Kluyveromyces dobzhanskii CBS 2104]|uniref:WGS project CCBQ000000000 data, contig MAT n=1 Tax=Kluyveromyces dobzhanskii CBS 2104 TaxID=1427455 RepID=A0A0A8L184_9SACH|nr:unnamed protein product [Kluyveromyces dobzhanskii CBS 2104]
MKGSATLKKGYDKFQYYFPCDRVLAKRIFKATVHSTVALIFCLIPKVRERLGTEPAMLPLISVMVHPGRRVSGTIQGAIYCVTGLIFGLAFSLLGRFLAQRCLGSTWHAIEEKQQLLTNYGSYRAGLAILAVFEIIMLFVHGWMRSVSHHYFGIVFPLFLVVHFTFLAPLTESAGVIANSFSTPFYLGIAMSLFWNLTLFPEFGSTYLGNTTVVTLNEIHHSLNNAIIFFLSIDEESKKLYATDAISSAKLLKMKDNIAKKVSACSAITEECIYEISYSYMSPTELQPVTSKFKDLSIYVSATINACQLEFMLLGHSHNEHDLLHIDTEKEIRHADADKLTRVLLKVKEPIFNLHKTLSDCFYLVKVILARDFDVELDKVRIPKAFENDDFPTFTSKCELPMNIDTEMYINNLIKALVQFDLSFREELSKIDADLLEPNDEMFLLASFLMNLKEITNTVISIMKSAQEIHNKRIEREDKGWLRGKSVWCVALHNRDTFANWFYGSTRKNPQGTENESLAGGNSIRFNPETVPIRPGYEEEELLSQQAPSLVNPKDFEKPETGLPTTNIDELATDTKKSRTSSISVFKNWVRKLLVAGNKFVKSSKHHFRFGFQVTVALMLASFPMFVPESRHWYVNIHGAWIGFVCILCLEPSVGGTFWVFFLRGVGVIVGAAWGYLSYVAGVNQTNPYLEVIVTIFGAVPGFYYLLGTPYIKAAIIQIISIYIVMLAAILPGSIKGNILQNFGKRCLAVGYGGGVALLVQVTLFPITARDQLNAEIAFAVGCLAEMETLYAAGIEGEALKLSLSDEKYERFRKLSEATKSALTRASAYKGLTRQEPRLKGEYTELENVFTQIIFILKQVVERFDNNVLLRRQYGSAIAEELNSIVYPYRRQYVASVVNILRAVQEAIINKTPLPQYLPSSRIAHRRLINKVRETLKSRYGTQLHKHMDATESSEGGDSQKDVNSDNLSDSSDSGEDIGLVIKPKHNVNMKEREFILKEKFLSWSASSSASEEIIEYIEELVELTKILVGVNEFKYGFLSRPLYEDWAAEAVVGFADFVSQTQAPRKPPTRGRELDDSGIAEDELNSLDDDVFDSNSDVEAIQPVALPTDDHVSRTLARMASNTTDHSNRKTSSKWRRRAYSIGSGMGKDDLNSLTKVQTLGESNFAIDDDRSSDEEDELPLVLKRIISHK